MKAKIFSFVKIADDSMVASVRIAKFVQETLRIPSLTWNETIAEGGPLDVLLIVNGAYAFAGNKILSALASAIEGATRVVWIQNDYTVIPPKDVSGAESPFRKAFRNRHEAGKPAVDYWTTVELMSKPGVAASGHRIGELSTYVNWNCLTTDVQEFLSFGERSYPGTLFYYGSFREDRLKYFDRYFETPTVPTTISSPSKKFSERYGSDDAITCVNKVDDLPKYLRHFGLGLYMEDRRSHREYHTPANRFYEMLSARLPIVFEPECRGTFDKYGIDINPFQIWNADDAVKLMRQQDEIVNAQNEWLARAIAERAELPQIVREQWKRYTGI